MDAPLGYLRLGSVQVYQVQLMVNSCSGAKRYTCRNVVKEDWIWISLDREFFFRGESYCRWGHSRRCFFEGRKTDPGALQRQVLNMEMLVQFLNQEISPQHSVFMLNVMSWEYVRNVYLQVRLSMQSISQGCRSQEIKV